MLTLDAAAKNEILAMRHLFALNDPVVVFGMSARIESDEDTLKEAFMSGDSAKLSRAYSERYEGNLSFSLAVTMHERVDLSSDLIFRIDDFDFYLPELVRQFVEGGVLCFDGRSFSIRGLDGALVELPLA